MKITRIDAPGIGPTWAVIEGVMALPTDGPQGRRQGEAVPLTDVRWLPPSVPRTLMAVGLNYHSHAAETGREPPAVPGVFLKAVTTLVEHQGKIEYPPSTQDLQYEGELALVIGRGGRDIPREKALDHLLGFTCAIDVTARDLQRRDLQWFRGKSYDTFCPLGPWIETEFDPASGVLTTRVNGERRQHAPTSDLIFDVPTLIAHLSGVITLAPGDVVLTGTPEGVGPLRVGDRVEVEISGIGILAAGVIARPAT